MLSQLREEGTEKSRVWIPTPMRLPGASSPFRVQRGRRAGLCPVAQMHPELPHTVTHMEKVS